MNTTAILMKTSNNIYCKHKRYGQSRQRQLQRLDNDTILPPLYLAWPFLFVVVGIERAKRNIIPVKSKTRFSSEAGPIHRKKLLN